MNHYWTLTGTTIWNKDGRLVCLGEKHGKLANLYSTSDSALLALTFRWIYLL